MFLFYTSSGFSSGAIVPYLALSQLSMVMLTVPLRLSLSYVESSSLPFISMWVVTGAGFSLILMSFSSGASYAVKQCTDAFLAF